MKRLMIVIPLLFVGSFLVSPDEPESMDATKPVLTTAEQIERKHAVRLIEAWQEDYVRSMTLEGGAREALARLHDEIEGTTLPYVNEHTSHLKDEAETTIDVATYDMENQNMSLGYEALEALADGYEVSR